MIMGYGQFTLARIATAATRESDRAYQRTINTESTMTEAVSRYVKPECVKPERRAWKKKAGPWKHKTRKEKRHANDISGKSGK